jgi:alpha-mannosidase
MLIPKAEQRITQYLNFLKKNRYRVIAPLEFEAFETGKTFRLPPADAAWKKIPSPYQYGTPWHCCWFRATFKIPARSGYPLYLRVIPNADSLVFIDGKPAGAFNPVHKKIKVKADGKSHTLHIESYCGHYYPGSHSFQGRQVILTLGRHIDDYPNTFGGGALVERVEPIYGLYYDVKCLFDLAGELPGDGGTGSLRKARIIRFLYEALMGIHYSSTGAVLEKEAEEARKRIAPLLKAKNGSTVPEIHLIGHAHIDHAWLWHIGETERKAARTFINMARLAEEYPEFVFIQSQPAQLEGVRENYPDIFNAVKEAFKKGNWEPNGGMWVEADCNVTGGESLVRQFLVGKKATREMLGYEGDTLWLPDVFGYAAALPQILAGCRIKYFVTSKINWNDTTRFPYDTFIWRGLDGSAVKTHYLSSRRQGYNGTVAPSFLNGLWKEIQHKEIQGGAVFSIGEGDGGGGTARGDLEMARRLENLEGAPKASWRKVSYALDRIFGKETQWPEWRGELYLELHRGTYTTQAKTKRYNRKNEFALRNAEWLSAVADLEGWAKYPKEDFLKNWKALLTLQFHDIIPGSSIARVYKEAEACQREIEKEISRLSAVIRKTAAGKTGGGIVAYNSLSWERDDAAYLDALALSKAPYLRASGSVAAAPAKRNQKAPAGIYPVQYYKDLDGKDAAVFSPRLPSMGWSCLSAVSAKEAQKIEGLKSESPFVYDLKGGTLKTPFYRVKFDKQGRITSLADRKTRREFVAQGGCFNGFVSADDVPIFWEAWDIDSDWTKYLKEETRLLSSELAADGPVCFILRLKYAIGEKSSLTQDAIFYSGDRRIDFVTKVDWKERQKLLKVGFDTAFDATQVRCEVQYGHLLRNTHRNLPHDRAKFEICAHKWISLEEEGGGVALLNDCKYGHDVSGGSMRLTLLRSPVAPDEEADIGEQRFTYSILPFTGPFGNAGVVRSGYELNESAVVDIGSNPGSVKGSGEYSFLSLEGEAVIVESVKCPEDDKKKTVVVRLYESLGGRTKTVLHFNRGIVQACLTDMLEGNPKPLRFSGSELPLVFRAFEIKTVMVTFK